MIGHDLARLLADAVHEAERRTAPPAEPVAALAHARRRREQRRGHLAVLSFVLFAAVLQLLPADAFGAQAPATAVTALADRPPVAVHDDAARLTPGDVRG